MTERPFHLAFPVADLQATIEFYHRILGCPMGRQASKWADFDFFGHQLSAHLSPEANSFAPTNQVDGDAVPVRHFGAILEWGEWQNLGEKLKAAEVPFVIDPKIRFKGKPGEQGIFFVSDPSGNVLEFKTFKSMDQIFDTGRTHDQ